jgi:hypothetical protein
MKAFLISLALLAAPAAYAGLHDSCDYRAIETELMHHYGYTPLGARAYTIAFESFLINMDLASVTLNQSVFEVNLDEVKTALIVNLGLAAARADYIVGTARLARAIGYEFGIAPTSRPCLGMLGRGSESGIEPLRRL